MMPTCTCISIIIAPFSVDCLLPIGVSFNMLLLFILASVCGPLGFHYC